MSSTCVITFTIELTRDGASIDFNQTDFGNGPAHVRDRRRSLLLSLGLAALGVGSDGNIPCVAPAANYRRPRTRDARRSGGSV